MAKDGGVWRAAHPSETGALKLAVVFDGCAQAIDVGKVRRTSRRAAGVVAASAPFTTRRRAAITAWVLACSIAVCCARSSAIRSATSTRQAGRAP
jgi:hypothetical protein